MDQDIKRRAFLGATVGTLLAAPFAFRYWGLGRSALKSFKFDRAYAGLQSKIDLPIRSLDATPKLPLALRPSVGDRWNYTMFTNVTPQNDEAEKSFFVREGMIATNKTPSGKTVLRGGDESSYYGSPRGKADIEKHTVALLIKENEFYPAKVTGQKPDPYFDFHLQNLLSLQGIPSRELTPGARWTNEKGRVFPFAFKTDYKVEGCALVGEVETIHLSFSGKTPDLAQYAEPAAIMDGQTMICEHTGDAYFSLATGMLVRQELHSTIHVTGKNVKPSDPAKSSIVLQLFEHA